MKWACATWALAALASIAATAPVRADPSDLEQLFSLLAQRQHGHAGFVEEKFLALLDRPIRSSGELLYDAPDHLEKRTLTPQRETLVLDHGVVSAQRGRRHYVLDLHQYPQIVPFIESIRATLAGDRAALERAFHIDFRGQLKDWTLSLRPLDDKLSGTVRNIHISGNGADIRRVEIAEADGDRAVLTIGADIPQ